MRLLKPFPGKQAHSKQQDACACLPQGEANRAIARLRGMINSSRGGSNDSHEETG